MASAASSLAPSSSPSSIAATGTATYTTTQLLLVQIPSATDIRASVLAANSVSTTYALGLGTRGTATITVGPPSTSGIYDAQIVTSAADGSPAEPLILHCTTSNAVPQVCDITTRVAGLGVTTTTTPSASQYTYYPVTLTEGADLLTQASTVAPTEAPTSSSSGAAVPTAFPGVAGMGSIGLLGLVLGRLLA
ncbi:hypothetical protein K402DRAFT_422593 [Aulographum hederae CBS 113979]|uniref:Uncharacterized protein n=1 Tax=Aulographum hederae CBS 113979 TaxID=1176131 RepID=A0A6G1GV53_9PEZI|nr:hypothetical protein K402DRAFT_422593 [Aulographum hederae CBS 113979]